MEVYLLTKNPGKILAAKAVFSKYGITVKNIDKEYPEIQAASSLEIARHMAVHAAIENKVPVIREDHSICLNALKGMPGPYVSQFDKLIPVETLIELLKNVQDRDGYFELAAVYAAPDGSTKEHTYKVPIFIAEKPRGSRGNWNKAIILKDRPGKTLGETHEEDSIEIWNKNFVRIAQELSGKH